MTNQTAADRLRAIIDNLDPDNLENVAFDLEVEARRAEEREHMVREGLA